MLLASLYFSLLGLTQTVVFEVRTDAGPVANQRVILISNTGEQIEEKKSDNKGRARFLVDSKKYPVIAAGSIYEEVPYVSAPVDIRQKLTTSIPIQVFPSSSDNSETYIEEMDFYVEESNGKLRVQQGFKIVNPSNKSIIPSESSSVFSFEVPSKAFEFSYERGFQKEDVANEGNTIKWRGALYPGSRYFSFSYAVDEVRFQVSLPQKFSIPIRSLSMISNSSEVRHLEPHMEKVGKKFYSGQWVDVFRSEDFNQSTFNLKIGGLPWNIYWYWWLPFLVSVLSLFIVLFSPKKAPTSSQRTESRKLLEEWLYLQSLKGQNLLSDKEYRERSLLLLEEIFPHFEESQNASSKSSFQTG